MKIDLKDLELTLQQMEQNLKSNTLNQLRQTEQIKEQIRINENKIKFLSTVSLFWELKEDCFETIGQVSSFRTRGFERDMIKPFLGLEAGHGDTWYVVSDSWF